MEGDETLGLPTPLSRRAFTRPAERFPTAVLFLFLFLFGMRNAELELGGEQESWESGGRNRGATDTDTVEAKVQQDSLDAGRRLPDAV